MKYKFKLKHLVLAVLVVKAVLYGGAKRAGTNAPPDDVSSPTNSPTMMCFSPRPMMLPPPEPTTNHQQPTNQIPNWTARGAYCDWERIDFCDGFRFPIGTNFIDGVTLLAYGEVRIKRGSAVSALVEDGSSASSTSGEDAASPLSGAPSTFIYSLPARVSLEPNASSVSHGLTPSNSYLFAWHNCCVERSATNRVNASIELFRNGAMATTVTPLSTPTPPTYTYYPPTLPEGVFGVGQDEAWIRANFPDEADHILAMGYENWLLNEYVGIDEENGHYLVRVTIDPSAFDQPPATNNQPPIYLSCGPYKVNVAEPGTYAFPLEVFEEYEAKAYPTSVPLAFEYDDGYRGEGGPSFEIVEVTEHPRLMMAAPALNQPPTTNNQPLSCIYRFFMRPKVVVTPNRVSLDEAEGKIINLWVNVTNTVERSWSSFAYNTRLSFTRNQAVIDEARVAELARILLEHDRRIASGELVITPLPIDESQLETNRFDVTIFEGETWHTAETNDLYVKYFTVPTEVGTTNLVLDTNVYGPPAGRSVYIGVFMASAEDMGNIADCCDDRISWNVQVNGMSVLSGETSAYAHHDTLYAMALETHRLYGIEWPLILLGGCQVDPPNGDDYGIRLIGTAQNAGDGLRQTCLQIGIFPIDDDGVVVGWPSWAQR